MQIQNLYPGGIASNCYLVSEGTDAVLIDCSARPQEIEDALAGATLHAILLTHGHFDHMLTAAHVAAHFGVPLYLHQDDADLPPDGEKNAYAVFFGCNKGYPAPDHTLAGGEHLCFGALSLDVLHTPGHTKGCVLYRAGEALFTGDTLFDGGYGRTDLYGGDENALSHSLHSLRALPPSLRIYPGHGGDTTLGAALQKLFFY